MEIEVRTFHLGRNSFSQEVVETYQKKIAPFEKISFRNIKDEKKALQGVQEADRVWACDERGHSFSSRDFAGHLSQMRDGAVKKLFFFVGGPFGLQDLVKQRANQTVLLSPLVMSQEVALVVLMEQLFRAYTIINNHPYHND